MSRKIMFSVIVMGALGVAAAFGAVAYRSAAAAASTSTASPALAAIATELRSVGLTSVIQATTATTSTMPLNDDRPGRGLEVASDEYLAAALGITTDELAAAYTAAKEAGIAQAVEQGLITQAQADEMLAGDGIDFGRHGKGLLDNAGIDYQALLAGALGISVEELEQAQLTAQSARLDQAVTDGAITQEQADLMKGRAALFNDNTFQTSMQSAFEAAVAQAVTGGVITQAQADQLLAQIADHGGLFGRDAFGLGMDGGRGHGGEHGGHGDGDFAPGTTAPDTTAPTSSEG